MNDLLLFWSNVLLVLLEVIVLVFFASVFFKKNLSRRKFGASVILLAISNITALALLDSHFWSKAFAVIIVDAIWLKISYDDTIMQSIGIAIGFYSFVSVWDVLVLLAVSFLSSCDLWIGTTRITQRRDYKICRATIEKRIASHTDHQNRAKCCRYFTDTKIFCCNQKPNFIPNATW